tara:strand:+ start:2631 stop:3188 length:558 start_codon:yes stop_codon:yes gene_type:complete
MKSFFILNNTHVKNKTSEFRVGLVYFNSFSLSALIEIINLLMAHLKKSVLVNHSASQMFALVDKVEDYPNFLPWCGGSSVTVQDNNVTHATVKIDYLTIKHSFTTKNTRKPPELIEMTLLNGPFKSLDGYWKFIPLDENACKIEFQLDYIFSNKLLEHLVGPVFYIIANNFVEAFIEHAENVHGQ